MIPDSEEKQLASAQLGELSLRVLIKTLIKCLIWFGMAWLITRIWPDIIWPWYVAWIFVAIGMGFSLFTLAIAFYSRGQENR